ncbi:two-component sensor histidine kinase [Paenibacillus barcinonensis]|uniref:histidine kinase n=1 Tax=Paenibacillus barcinonensis TaxID=198119 RepID=A0A2V4VT02_PAEBA|nr:histidine kinase [Paenibacillus barcinonensis]PYE45408.1 two-component system nitrate/nitrite sensor histidine kinase NarQ [Paenibacillus barcinonensis]QKS55225.1 two-component sensor histidine kinase [Paenibacillus barcinonensis]
MSYKQIKWMILFIPTITVALWEYVRHQFLLPYISMDLGNWLTPVFVYIVSITLLTRLFQMLEKMQRELERARADKAALEAKEQLARELHDGIAQSLFLLSVKAEKLEKGSRKEPEQHNENILSIRKTIHEVNRYVRQAIANLRQDREESRLEETKESALQHQIKSMIRDIRTPIIVDWDMKDNPMENKEKIELLACVREALINMDKHAGASSGHIKADGLSNSWKISITDNGQGFEGDPFAKKNKFGLRIMKERCSEMGWVMNMYRENEQTIVEIRKGGAA